MRTGLSERTRQRQQCLDDLVLGPRAVGMDRDLDVVLPARQDGADDVGLADVEPPLVARVRRVLRDVRCAGRGVAGRVASVGEQLDPGRGQAFGT